MHYRVLSSYRKSELRVKKSRLRMKKSSARFFHVEPVFDAKEATFFIEKVTFSNGNGTFSAGCAANYCFEVFCCVKKAPFPGVKATLIFSRMSFFRDPFFVKKNDLFCLSSITSKLKPTARSLPVLSVPLHQTISHIILPSESLHTYF